jgi:hypothetical protein
MMKAVSGNENAYLTVYLSLIFGIVLSLLLVLIEGAAIGAVRAQAEIVADLGLDSVFAEYNREILNQYELFFVDSSYGTSNGGVGKVEARLSEYMGYNMNPANDKIVLGENMLLTLRNPYLQINKVSYATDEECAVWKSQAVNYMKAVYGGDLVSTVKSHIDTVNENGLTDKDVVEEISRKKEEFERSFSDEEIEEYGEESESEYSYSNVSGVFDKIVGEGILTLVMPAGGSISGAVADNGPYFSNRGAVNKGNGLHEGADRADGITDELIYGEYLMTMCGTYTDTKDEGLLKYQIEYILYGENSDVGNLRKCAERLFAVRAASNVTSIFNDGIRKNEVKVVATAICTLIGQPQLGELLTDIILGIWGIAEAASDVNILLGGGKVPIMKSHGDWNVSLKGLLGMNIFGGNKSSNGLSYNDYLRVFLGIMDKTKKVQRSLDIVEMDIRKTGGNENFRIDRCIDYINVSFGFEDSNGHDFVFSRNKCYE